MCRERWMDDNLLSLLGNHRGRKTKLLLAAEATASSLYVDFCLKTNPNLEIVCANAADLEAQAMEVSDQQNFS